MLKKTLLSTALMLAMGGLASSAQAVDINDYTLNFSDASTAMGGGAIANVLHVDEWKFTAFSVVGFYDNDGSKSITAGDKYEDFVNVRIDGFQDKFGNNISVPGYGTTHELSVITEFGGTQQVSGPPGAYSVDFMKRFDVIFDTTTPTNTFTPANTTVIGSFSNGLVVENGTLIAGSGANNLTTLPDGTIDLIIKLNDLLHTMACGNTNCGYFEKDLLTDAGILVDVGGLLLGLVDANNLGQYSSLTGVAPGAPQKAVIDLKDAEFANLGCTYDANGVPTCTGQGGKKFDFIFVTKSDGSLNKVPEPGTLLLLGGGLLGLGANAYRRRTKKA